MKMKEQKDKQNISLVKNVLNKFKYSGQGLLFCLQNESSFVLVAICGCIIIILGVLFDIEFLEWVISFGSLALISVVELINTAIESMVDMVTQEYNEYAKIAKDCGSAATGIISILATIVNLIIFIPYFIELFIEVF